MKANTPPVDITSQTWAELRRWLINLQKNEIGKLQDVNRDINETNVIRGSLLVIDRILGFEENILKANQKAFD